MMQARKRASLVFFVLERYRERSILNGFRLPSGVKLGIWLKTIVSHEFLNEKLYIYEIYTFYLSES